jgi:AhpD family alkylhydroperoxidase
MEVEGTISKEQATAVREDFLQKLYGCRDVTDARKVDRGTFMKFRKRFYTSVRELATDILYLARNVRGLSRANSGRPISSAFRERLMLAVTAVYGCRYCSYFHTKRGLQSGIDGEEAAALLAGSLEVCPPEEVVALLYAQHWAESNANPDAEAVERLEYTYGTEKAKAINLVLRMVRVGNLAGNLWDYFLYRLSRGKWGN